MGMTGMMGAQGPAGPMGMQGPAGSQGPAGPKGMNGISCWDRNGNGVNDPNEDRNNDGKFDYKDCDNAYEIGLLWECIEKMKLDITELQIEVKKLKLKVGE
jgi:hypothetical protein